MRIDRKLRAELLRRAARDQEIRFAVIAERTNANLARMSEADGENTAWLATIVRTQGWPGIALVGTKAAHAAWLLAQHADASPAIQQEFHAALTAAVAQGDAPVRNLAYLEDRVRVHAGRPQLYGTQFVQDHTGFHPFPIEDAEHLAERRAQIGLEPFHLNEQAVRATYSPQQSSRNARWRPRSSLRRGHFGSGMIARSKSRVRQWLG
ncbi:DUF6624 domain-containing protein [Acrocarpospora macrocephala]|uniref:DUF6624 domain-containing protein n=1 Tax=Acrocarpospora macrocephala TaxID=150177 RepID=UPI0015839F46|nr:DUF6624 domain-containing protein [Acrocarpospora macrocephala]